MEKTGNRPFFPRLIFLTIWLKKLTKVLDKEIRNRVDLKSARLKTRKKKRDQAVPGRHGEAGFGDIWQNARG